MNPAVILALIASLYEQVLTLQEQNAALRRGDTHADPDAG